MLWIVPLILIFIYYNYKSYNKKQFLKQQQDTASYYEEISKVLLQTTALQHDMKNHLYILERHLNDKHYQDAQNYLQNLLQTSPFLFPHISSPDRTLSAILSVKQYLCQNTHIPFYCQISFLHIYQLSPFDMTTIFSNLLDNAIEACRYVAADRRYIRLSISQADTYLYIVCRNSMQNMLSAPPKSIPPLTNLSGVLSCRHTGTGLQNIRKALKHYNGKIEIEKGSQDFSVIILLPNHPCG